MTSETSSPSTRLSEVSLQLDSGMWQRLLFVWQLLKNDRKAMVLLVVLEVVFSLLNAVIPYFAKFQIDHLSGSTPRWVNLSATTYFFLLLAVPVLLELLRLFVFNRVQYWVEQRFRHSLRLSLDSLIWERLKTFDGAFFQNPQNAPIIYSAQDSASSVIGYFFFFLRQTRAVVTVLAILPLLGSISWMLLAAVLVTALSLVLITQWSRQAKLAGGLEDLQMSDKARRVQWALKSSFPHLRQYAAVDKMIDESQRIEEQRFLLSQRQYRREQLFSNLQWSSEQVFTMGVTLWVGFQVFSGAMTIGTFTLTVSYIQQLYRLFSDLMSSLNDWLELNLNFTAIQFFFALKTRLKYSETRVNSLSLPLTLTLHDVDFTYPELWADEQKFMEFRVQQLEEMMKKTGYRWYSHEIDRWKSSMQKTQHNSQVLHQVNFALQTGKVTAVLGRNGAGKTTLTQLLLHEYEPDAGQALLNGIPLYDYDQTFLLQQFALLQQQPFLLMEYSVRENILLASQEQVSDEKIWSVLEEIDAKNFVKAMPQGLDTVIGRDTQFSGGQQQLLALARCLVSPRPIIIFDEASSQLDVERERLVLAALRRRLDVSAVLFITHRVSVARKADEIVMIDKGKIVEHGTHTELLSQKGLYAKFWNTQVED